MYSPTSQAVIHSSKRNTTYLLPSSVLDDNNTTSNTVSSNDVELLENESSPFPVDHIKDTNGGSRHVQTSIAYSLDNDSTDDEILAALARNTKILEKSSPLKFENSDSCLFRSPIKSQASKEINNSTQFMKSEFVHEKPNLLNSPPKITSEPPLIDTNGENSPKKESTDSSGTSSLSKISSNNDGNIHINQYYFHVGEMQLEREQKESAEINTIPTIEPTESEVNHVEMNRYNYVPHQKTDRVVAIKNNYINGNSKSVQKLQAQKEHQNKLEKSKKSKSKDEKRKSSLKAPIESLENITQIDEGNEIKKQSQSSIKPTLAQNPDLEPVLNASLSSDNGLFFNL
jgi:hypothetical protein